MVRGVRNKEDPETLILVLVAEREREERALSELETTKISFLPFVMFFSLLSISKQKKKKDK